jgi:hypothetical protein
MKRSWNRFADETLESRTAPSVKAGAGQASEILVAIRHRVWRQEEITMGKKHCNVGLDDRCRDRDGEIRQKRGDTLVRTIRQTYPNFAPGVRNDARLDTLRERTGKSLSRMVRKR